MGLKCVHILLFQTHYFHLCCVLFWLAPLLILHQASSLLAHFSLRQWEWAAKMWSLCGLKLHCLNRWKPQNPSPFSFCALWGQGRWKTCVMTYSAWLGFALANIGCRWQPRSFLLCYRGDSLDAKSGVYPWSRGVHLCTQFLVPRWETHREGLLLNKHSILCG